MRGPTTDQMREALETLGRVAEVTGNARAAAALAAIRAEAEAVEAESGGDCMQEGYALSAVLGALY